MPENFSKSYIRKVITVYAPKKDTIGTGKIYSYIQWNPAYRAVGRKFVSLQLKSTPRIGAPRIVFVSLLNIYLCLKTNYLLARYASCYSFLLVLGLWPSVRWKITSDNGNLRNLRYTKNICHVMLALIT